jgi:hypothetical protein
MLIFDWSIKSTNENSSFIKSSFIHSLHNTMGDRYNIHSQLEHLQSKYVGKINKEMKIMKNY